jgi:large subunit ribosomal protein L30
MPAKLRITYVRSAIGYNARQRKTARALGLNKLGDRVDQDDTPAIRGMIHKISHLLRVEEVNA